MGGTIIAQSPAIRRRGTRIVLRFPIPEQRRKKETGMSAIRVLVVDDEPQIHRFLRPALTACGYEVRDGRQWSGRAAAHRHGRSRRGRSGPRATGHGRQGRLAGGRAASRKFQSLSCRRATGRRRKSWRSTLARTTMSKNPSRSENSWLGCAPRCVTRPMRGATPTRIESGGLCIDFDKRFVTKNGVAVKLTPKEYDLLAMLASHAGRLLTHQQILTAVWGPAHQR